MTEKSILSYCRDLADQKSKRYKRSAVENRDNIVRLRKGGKKKRRKKRNE